ncbi:MAG: cyclase family protein [Oscillospiraceae bacterium]|nr:cyclase family protein [Oscillospiraceae bacterium]
MIYDISQELFSCRVYPGDPAPEKQTLQSIEAGQVCNLSALSLCAHNGTHVDAPFHFFRDGRTVDELGLAPFVGACRVFRHAGDVTAADAERMLALADAERILIAGPVTVTADAARVFAAAKLRLLGNESQTVGPEGAPMEVHLLLLGAGTVLLEGLVLDGVPEGRYLLNAAPLNLGGCDGAPCRAWLMTPDEAAGV